MDHGRSALTVAARALAARRLPTRIRFGSMVLLAGCSILLLLSGCAAETGEAPAPAEESTGVTDALADVEAAEPTATDEGAAPSGGSGVATARIDGTDYTFDLAFCAIGDDDTLVHGPGTSSADEDAYLDVDFQHFDGRWDGEVRIDLGVGGQLESSDHFYLFTTHREGGDQLIANIAAMSMFSATGTYWVDGEQAGVDGNLEVECS